MLDAVLDLPKSLDNHGILNYDDRLSDRIVRQLSFGSRAVLSPMCAAIGGIFG